MFQTLIRSFAFLAVLVAAVACTRLDSSVVEVGGRDVEIVEVGAGEATVVFESGFGNDWTPWDEVADNVSAHARVFAYSRPGYGDSEWTTTPRDATHIVEELRALLAARAYAPPYVLVGHSFGGTYMELYAKRYPAEVAGLVLVDPRHRDFTAACAEAGLDGCVIPASAVPGLPREQRAEYEAFATAPDEIRAAGGFGAFPVRVLIATEHGFSSPVEALWQEMLGALAGEAASGEQVLFRGAGHYLHVDEAGRVTEEILGLL